MIERKNHADMKHFRSGLRLRTERRVLETYVESEALRPVLQKGDREQGERIGEEICLYAVENKKRRAFGECLGTKRRRRTQHFAKSRGEMRAIDDPRVSEWGNPPLLRYPLMNT